MSERTQLLMTYEGANLLQMPTVRLSRLAREGKVPCVRLPDGELRFDEADLWAWVESHKQGEEMSK